MAAGSGARQHLLAVPAVCGLAFASAKAAAACRTVRPVECRSRTAGLASSSGSALGAVAVHNSIEGRECRAHAVGGAALSPESLVRPRGPRPEPRCGTGCRKRSPSWRRSKGDGGAPLAGREGNRHEIGLEHHRSGSCDSSARRRAGPGSCAAGGPGQQPRLRDGGAALTPGCRIVRPSGRRPVSSSRWP